MAKFVAEDSTGKNKLNENKARNRAIAALFVVGLCAGLIVSERVYISRGGSVPKPRILQTAYDRHHPRHAGVQATGVPHTHSTGGSESSNRRSAAAAAGEVGVILPIPDNEPARSDLEALLRKVAPNHEVMVAVSNKNIMWDNMLLTFLNGVVNSGVHNHVVIALDQETKDFCDKNNFNAILMDPSKQKVKQGAGDNHAVSAMKFGILKQFVQLGWAVLLSDVDIAILQNPFDHLYRDSDVEGQTDGFDDGGAYGFIDGFDDPTMGWARYAQAFKHFNLNSGLFYLKANTRTLSLLERLEERLIKGHYWDQTAYNEEIFTLSHGSYRSPQVTVRVMEIDKFMNSKRLFKNIRHLPKDKQPPKPVTVHINYHPDKHERMKAVFKYYNEGDSTDLMRFPGGSEAGSR